MVKKHAFLLIPLLTVLLFTSLSMKWGMLPRMGFFLSPFTGFWMNVEHGKVSDALVEAFPAKGNVQIHVDQWGIPHIYAENAYDLYAAHGYMVAKDRLFQMEVQVRDAAGTLSELVGRAALARDKATRRSGLSIGAERSAIVYLSDDTTASILQAYSDGVNAYIHQLRAKDWPVEYKLLDASPFEWKPEYSGYLLANMTNVLTGGNSEEETVHSLKRFGASFLDQFLFAQDLIEAPVIPEEETFPFTPLAVPAAPSEVFLPRSSTHPVEPYQPHPNNGSNNWALAGSKTTTGHPILVNDPHLNLTVPSIWYLVHLNAPGINAMGVTIPGSPELILGFNEHLAWGVTNSGVDVKDVVEVVFRNKKREEYWHDDVWKNVSSRLEHYRVKHGTSSTDTVRFTHHGPIVSYSVSDDGQTYTGRAMTWIAHQPGNELRFFSRAARAINRSEFEKAIPFFEKPSQNVVVADKAGDIALYVSGKLPLRWKHQGQLIGDGTSSQYDIKAYIPTEHNPKTVNPARGFVSSANQVTAGSNYPYYLGLHTPTERGIRINELLRSKQTWSAEEMRLMMMDNHNVHAERILPAYLKHIPREQLTADERAVLSILEGWEYRNAQTSAGALVFKHWDERIHRAIWQSKGDRQRSVFRYPGKAALRKIVLSYPNDSHWFDLPSTESKETLSEILIITFKAMVESLTERYGPVGVNWQWGNESKVVVRHLGQLSAFDLTSYPTDGDAKSINAMNGSHGPSWRLVAELGPTVKAAGIYPGGQSGNPGSPKYDSFFELWRKGELIPLPFPAHAEALPKPYHTITFVKEQP